MQTAVKTKAELLSRIIANSNHIRQYGVKRLGLFGSFVRDEANENSDVDFFVEFYPDKKTFKNFMRLADILELTGRKTELIPPSH